MATRVIPPPERFGIRRTGDPDRLAPAITVPAAPDTNTLPETAPVPAEPPREPVHAPA